MDRCPICGLPIDGAVVLCGQCGEELPLYVVVVSEGSDDESLFAVVRSTGASPAGEPEASKEDTHGRCVDRAGS